MNVSTAARAPFTRRQARELLFCLAAGPFALLNPIVSFVVTVDLIWLAADGARGNPSTAEIAAAFAVQALLLVLLVSTPAARRLGAAQRRLAARLLGVHVGPPPRSTPGPRDAAGWR